MESLQDRAEKIKAEFAAFPGWEERYRHLIEMGKSWPSLPEEMKTETHLVKGCQSQVWLHAKMEGPLLVLQGDSDALIVKGLVATLLRVYSSAPPQEILAFPPQFLKDLGFEGNLSPSRANGLHSMLKQIRHYALAFDYLSKAPKTN